MSKLKDLKKQLNGASVEEALEFFIRSAGRATSVPVEKAAAEYLTSIERSGASQAHLSTARFHMGVVSVAFKGSPVHALERSELEDHIYGNEDWGPRSKLNHWRALKAFIAWCKRAGYAGAGVGDQAYHPLDAVPAPKLRQKTPCTFTPGELQKLLDASSGYARTFLAIAAFTGLRAAEIHRLRWENFKWDSGVLFVPPEVTKTNRRRSVPLEPALSYWIPNIPSEGPVMPVKSVYDALCMVAQRAHVEWKPNALRHSFATYHLARGNNAAETATVCGHAPQILETRYRDLKTPAEGVAWFSVAPEIP